MRYYGRINFTPGSFILWKIGGVFSMGLIWLFLLITGQFKTEPTKSKPYVPAIQTIPTAPIVSNQYSADALLQNVGYAIRNSNNRSVKISVFDYDTKSMLYDVNVLNDATLALESKGYKVKLTTVHYPKNISDRKYYQKYLVVSW